MLVIKPEQKLTRLVSEFTTPSDMTPPFEHLHLLNYRIPYTIEEKVRSRDTKAGEKLGQLGKTSGTWNLNLSTVRIISVSRRGAKGLGQEKQVREAIWLMDSI